MRVVFCFIALFIIALINCNCFQSEREDNNLDFQKYIETLPTVKLPIKIDCDNNLTPIKNPMPDSLIMKYGISNQSYVFGKCILAEKFVAVIYIVIADEYVPIMKTSDRSGNTIDVLTLLKNCGGNDICYEANSWAEITADLKILIKDTIKTCALDTLDSIIPGSEKIESEIRELLINEEGKFVVI